MANDSFFQSIAHDPESPLALSPQITQMLTTAVRDAILSDSEERLVEIVQETTKLFDNSAILMDKEAAKRLVRGRLDKHEAELHLLGQISFAQNISESILAKKSWTCLEALSENSKYFPYIQILKHEHLSNKDLAAKLGKTPETVSRNLKELREEGITDFRREGVQVVNFLTPGAESLYLKLDLPKFKPAKKDMNDKFREFGLEAPDYFEVIQTFSAPRKAASG